MSAPLNAGLGVAETAARLAGVRAALRDAVVETARRLAAEPRLEVKAALAAHLYDDARSAAKLDARIADLGGAPEDARPVADVVAEAEALLAAIDPAVDEATLRALTQLVHRRRRHAEELDPRLHDQRERVPEVDLPSPSVSSIEAAEAAARAIADGAGDWQRTLDLARIAADSMRHAQILERLPEDATAALQHVRAEQAAHERIRAAWRG